MRGRALALLLAAGCGGGGGGASDASVAGDARLSRDAAQGGDAIQPLAWVDFTLTGCVESSQQNGGGEIADAGPGADAGAPEPPCIGTAPLTVQFAAVAPSPIAVYQWRFGDGAMSSQAAPEHTYSLPGQYSVSLGASGPGGSASANKPDKILVDPAPLGSQCTLDLQCASAECICDDEANCPSLAAGLCAAACDGESPCDQGVCADLTPVLSPAEEWRQSLCLVDCSGGAPCPAGLTCQELPGDAGDGWVRGCLSPGLLGQIGDSCTGDSGVLQDNLCASGSCLDEGARGLCSAACTPDAGDCPPSSACASFDGGGTFCLARCDADTTCDSDPWLACEAPGGAGAKSFTVDETAAEDGYCAPKSCADDEACGPDGACSADGFCGPA